MPEFEPFDHFIVVDWSSRSKPSPAKPTKDAIWVAQATAEGKITTRYFRTRHYCVDYMTGRLARLHGQGKRVFVGWDFAFGYPTGLSRALGCKKKQGWKFIWKLLDKLIVDQANNKNNRFQVGALLNGRLTGGSGPFWGAPRGESGIFLHTKRDFSYPVRTKRATLAERRLTERRVKKTQPAWKLAYAGSVGGQSLVGIPYLRRLCKGPEDWRKAALVWPFSTNFERKLPARGPITLHAEIYPSMLTPLRRDKIPDREQVRTYVAWLQQQARDGRMSEHLAGPKDLSDTDRKIVVRHEGWIFGVG